MACTCGTYIRIRITTSVIMQNLEFLVKFFSYIMTSTLWDSLSTVSCCILHTHPDTVITTIIYNTHPKFTNSYIGECQCYVETQYASHKTLLFFVFWMDVSTILLNQSGCEWWVTLVYSH